jgi:hypothetical protein
MKECKILSYWLKSFEPYNILYIVKADNTNTINIIGIKKSQ